LIEQIELLNQTINKDLSDSKETKAINMVLTDSTLRSDIDTAFKDYLFSKQIQLMDIDLRGNHSLQYDESKLIEALINIAVS